MINLHCRYDQNKSITMFTQNETNLEKNQCILLKINKVCPLQYINSSTYNIYNSLSTGPRFTNTLTK